MNDFTASASIASVSHMHDRLVVVSSVLHYSHDGRLYAYAPYAREINVWADLFRELVIAAPLRYQAPPGDCVAFARANVRVAPQIETGGTTIGAKVRQLVLLPRIALSLARAMRQGDAVHVRCPCNLGLIAAVLAPLLSRRIVAKYAGQWTGYPGEPWSVRLQRRILGSWWWRGVTTVYGRWPNQPSHVVPFFTSVLEAHHLDRARLATEARSTRLPRRILYVGRLSAAKNVDVLLDAFACVARTHEVECVIVGEGVQRKVLERHADDLGLRAKVTFTGGLDFEDVLELYAECDVLVLASESEGWPKAIAEAMAFGMICVGSNRGLVPEMLGSGRGLLVEPRNVALLASALEAVVSQPDQFRAMQRAAATWGQSYSLDGLRDAIRALLTEWWEVRPRSSQLLSIPNRQ